MSSVFLRGWKLYSAKRYPRHVLFGLVTGASLYQLTIGKTTPVGSIHGDTPFETVSSSSSLGLYNPHKHPLTQSPILTKINPSGHVLQSDKEIIRIKRTRITTRTQGVILTYVIQGIFLGYVFFPQRVLSQILPHDAESHHFIDQKVRQLLQDDVSVNSPEDDSHSAACQDLRSMSDISSVKRGTSLMGHFWVVDISSSSITLLFGDPSPLSDMAGLIQVDVHDHVAGREDEVEVGFTTVMFNPKENKEAFSTGMWAAHLLYSRMLLKNGALWACWPRLWGVLTPV